MHPDTNIVQYEFIWYDFWPVMFGPYTEKSEHQEAKRKE